MSRITIKKAMGIGFLLAAGFLLFYHLFYKATQVGGNNFKLNRILMAHTADVWIVKFSPQGKWLASGSVDSTILFWNKENGSVIHSIKHPAGVTSLSFSPDDNYLVSGSYDGKVRLWKLPEGTLVKEFVGHQGTVWSVDFSADGNTVASSGDDKTIRLWDISSGEQKHALTDHKLIVWDIKFSPDGKYLASGSFDHTIKIWDVMPGNLLHTISSHTEAVVSLAFSHDGQKLVSTSDDKSIKIWNTQDWSLIRTLHTPEHQQAVDFSPDDSLLIMGGRDKPAIGELMQNFFGDSRYNPGVSMRLWNVHSGKLLQTFSAHANDVNDVSFSNDGKWFAGASSDRTVSVWNKAK